MERPIFAPPANGDTVVFDSVGGRAVGGYTTPLHLDNVHPIQLSSDLLDGYFARLSLLIAAPEGAPVGENLRLVNPTCIAVAVSSFGAGSVKVPTVALALCGC